MLKKKIAKIFVTFNSLMLLAPSVALAQEPPYTIPETNLSIERVFRLFIDIMNWIFAFAIVLSVIFIIWGGVTYIMSGGDDAKTTEARKRIMWGLVGVAIVIAAWGLVQLVARFLDVDLRRPV